MLTIQQKAQYVLWYNELKSPTAVQRKFINDFGQEPPHTNSIKRWFKNFMETGSILDRKRSGRPSIDEETVDAVRVAFHRSSRKSIRVASNELAIPRSTVHKVFHKRLRLHAYKLQIVQALKPDDRPRRAAFAEEILQRIDDDMMAMATLTVCVFPTKQLFMYPGKSISITFEYGVHKILARF